MDTGNPAADFQHRILPHVSRTFALTIPQLPMPLRMAVTNAYLLCRIADTIEDEPALPAAETRLFLQRFTAVVRGSEPAAPLARELVRRLSERTLPAERELVTGMERVIAVTASLGEQRPAIERCIELMCLGMHHFQQTASLAGLARSSDLDSYCYYVAGVVGEMLTELFCCHSSAIAAQRAALQELSTSFGEGLQLTNIIKDFWEDRSRGACWFPREVFARHGVELGELTPQRSDDRFQAGVRELVAVAHGHLRNALAYALLLPAQETGVRLFCLWAIGLAVLTLRRIDAHPGYTRGEQVKVSHSAVLLVRLSTAAVVRNDRVLRGMFEYAARGLPLAPPLAVRRAASRAALTARTASGEQAPPARAERRSELSESRAQ
ncbi:MAG TPA: phytoene/squalene synthase family protein [Steroidobacteraceae bacterium]|nr:phytoene/squalene synthase family protein [Steroidobacteraceae bacterium]